MISMHFVKFKYLSTVDTLVKLTLICRQPVSHIKSTDRELTFVAGQQLFIDAGLSGDIHITHQVLDF